MSSRAAAAWGGTVTKSAHMRASESGIVDREGGGSGGPALGGGPGPDMDEGVTSE